MRFLQALLLVSAAVCALGYKEEEHPAYPYKYNYEVSDEKTGDKKSHYESREGDVVKGYYSLVEADGTLREVHYTADKHNGFKAVVKKTGTPIVQKEPVYKHQENHYEYAQDIHQSPKHHKYN